MDNRKRIILRAVVDKYIENAEPVGSKSLAGKQELELSSATLRNEMAVLEELGYLEHPHTSAGRVPTARGYRLYVNELMNRYRLSVQEMESINRSFSDRLKKLDSMLGEAGSLLAQLTQYASFTLSRNHEEEHVTLKKVEAFLPDEGTVVLVAALSTGAVKTVSLRIPEELLPVSDNEVRELAQSLPDRPYGGRLKPLLRAARMFIQSALEQEGEVYLHGEAHLLSQPEYQDLKRAQRTLKYLSENRRDLAGAIGHPGTAQSDGVSILIGPENAAKELEDASVVMARYDIGGGMKGLIGVIGPTRMDYARLASRLSYFAEQLGKRLKE